MQWCVCQKMYYCKCSCIEAENSYINENITNVWTKRNKSCFLCLSFVFMICLTYLNLFVFSSHVIQLHYANMQVLLYYLIHEYISTFKKKTKNKTYSGNKSLIFKFWARVLHRDVQVFGGIWLTFTKQPSLIFCFTEPCGKIPFGKGPGNCSEIVHSL